FMLPCISAGMKLLCKCLVFTGGLVKLIKISFSGLSAFCHRQSVKQLAGAKASSAEFIIPHPAIFLTTNLYETTD
ncbi:hypothetical protein, partial [Buttiauxella gaviniae]|uniref:hypothetical protein n=1 Tax=Buttiauxella gaviniae TaxID=82990 RepID=UPI0039B06C48